MDEAEPAAPRGSRRDRAFEVGASDRALVAGESSPPELSEPRAELARDAADPAAEEAGVDEAGAEADVEDAVVPVQTRKPEWLSLT